MTGRIKIGIRTASKCVYYVINFWVFLPAVAVLPYGKSVQNYFLRFSRLDWRFLKNRRKSAFDAIRKLKTVCDSTMSLLFITFGFKMISYTIK